jgi:hypothetical protein
VRYQRKSPGDPLVAEREVLILKPRRKLVASERWELAGAAGSKKFL